MLTANKKNFLHLQKPTANYFG